jgi:hypothetical protein
MNRIEPLENLIPGGPFFSYFFSRFIFGKVSGSRGSSGSSGSPMR